MTVSGGEMKTPLTWLMILLFAAVGTAVPGAAHAQEPSPGSAPRQHYEWDTWPKKPVVVQDEGKAQSSGDAEKDAGAEAGSREGRKASAGILSGTTAKVVLVGAILIGGAVALGSGGGGSTSNH